MFRRLLVSMIAILAFTTIAFAEVAAPIVAPPPPEAPGKIPHVAVLIYDRTNQWDQDFFMDGIKDIFIDRYSYLMSPAEVEVIKKPKKVDLSQKALAAYAEQKKADQVIFYVIDRADLFWFPSWHVGSRTNFDSDDSYVTTTYIRGAMYQPSTGKYALKKHWTNTPDNMNVERVLRDSTFQLIKDLEKEVPPLL